MLRPCGAVSMGYHHMMVHGVGMGVRRAMRFLLDPSLFPPGRAWQPFSSFTSDWLRTLHHLATLVPSFQKAKRLNNSGYFTSLTRLGASTTVCYEACGCSKTLGKAITSP